ncbi:MAG: hypothetical protein DRI90_14715, partial [Deltaproteobacteria bacterium]
NRFCLGGALMGRLMLQTGSRALGSVSWRVATAAPWLLTVLWAAGLGLVACAEPDGAGVPVTAVPAGSCECAAAAPVVDPALLAFLSKAKAIHHQADMAEEDQAPEQAIEVLLRLVDGPVPGGQEPPPEVREVLADTLARLAELRSARGGFEAAKQDVQRGLALAVKRSHYRGRLMEVLGVVEQRLHRKLLDDGDEGAAKEAKNRAIEAFGQAVAIQDDVIRDALGDGGR